MGLSIEVRYQDTTIVACSPMAGQTKMAIVPNSIMWRLVISERPGRVVAPQASSNVRLGLL